VGNLVLPAPSKECFFFSPLAIPGRHHSGSIRRRRIAFNHSLKRTGIRALRGSVRLVRNR